MELLKFFQQNNLQTYEDISKVLSGDPYHLKIKEKDNLYLISYNREKGNITNQLVYQCNGLILEKETNKIVCYGTDNLLEDEHLGKLDPNSIVIEECIDGTLIKGYYYNNKWNYSTNNCIDANDSYWYSNKSFYQLFCEGIDVNILQSKMNTNYCYSFILKHPENSLIVQYPKAGIVQSHTRDLTTMQTVVHNLGIEVPQIYPVSLNDIIQQNKNMTTSIVGFLVTDKNGIKVKCLSDKFKSAKNLINNNYDLVFICFDIIKNNQISEFKKIFPQYCFFMDHIIRNYKYYINIIYSIYIKRFITKEEYPHKPEFNMFIRHLHSDYLQTKKKITKKIIEEKLKLYSTKYIYDIYCNNNRRT